MTKQCIQQAVFPYKENVYITYISHCSFVFCIHYTNKKNYLTLANVRKIDQTNLFLTNIG